MLGALLLAGACATTTGASGKPAEQTSARRDAHAEVASRTAKKSHERSEAAGVQQQIRRLESPGH
jgi:hypothetical protein